MLQILNRAEGGKAESKIRPAHDDLEERDCFTWEGCDSGGGRSRLGGGVSLVWSPLVHPASHISSMDKPHTKMGSKKEM